MRRSPGAYRIRNLLASIAQALLDRYAEYGSDEWEWCDERLTYNCARVPQALILAGTHSKILSLPSAAFARCFGFSRRT